MAGEKKVWKTHFKDIWNGLNDFGADKTMSLLTGIQQIAGIGANAANISDTPEFDDALSAVRSGGIYNYSTYDQVLSEMQNNYSARQDFDSVRNMDEGQRFGTIGSGALAGASAGSVLGLPGIIGGGILGTLGSAIGLSAGDEKARKKVALDNYDMFLAEGARRNRYQGALENIANNNAVQGQIRAVARGGQIHRQSDIHEFASKVLGQRSVVYRPKREYCKGGLKVRIKVK